MGGGLQTVTVVEEEVERKEGNYLSIYISVYLSIYLFICKSTYLSRIYTVVEGEVEREEGYIPVTTDPEEEANSLTLLVQEGVRYSGFQKI